MITEKLTTIARPYALAAFEYALDQNDLVGWENTLQNAARISENKDMAFLLNNPEINQKEVTDIFEDLLKGFLDAEKKNFIRLLAEYRRLEALPEITELFGKYRADYEKTMTVEILSAVPLSSAHQQKYIDALTRRLKRKVSLRCKIDESLIGGALIRAGDMVIDGSIRGKLNRLLESI